jgi:hypothetical protein
VDRRESSVDFAESQIVESGLEGRGAKGSASDGCRLHHAAFDGGQTIESGEHRGMSGVRHRFRPLHLSNGWALRQAAHQFRSKERVPPGALHYLVADLLRQIPSQLFDQSRSLVLVQGFEDERRKVLSATASPVGAPVQQLGTTYRNHHQGRLRSRMHHVLDEIKQALARPMKILKRRQSVESLSPESP